MCRKEAKEVGTAKGRKKQRRVKSDRTAKGQKRQRKVKSECGGPEIAVEPGGISLKRREASERSRARENRKGAKEAEEDQYRRKTEHQKATRADRSPG